MWRQIKKVIHQHEAFLLTTHVNPDGDGIGSACALIELLKMMNKKVRFSCDSEIPRKFQFLDFYSLLERYHPDIELEDFEVLIMIDTHEKSRIGKLADLISNPTINVICIDHHQPSEIFTPYCAIDSHASSTGAMVYTLFKECGFDLNLKAAMGLYASIFCDTGRFSYSSTDRKAHKIAEECIKKGVDPDWMYAHLFRQVSLKEVKVLSIVLKNIEFHCNEKVIVQQISYSECQDLGAGFDAILHHDLEYIHEFNKMIIGIECTVLLREMQNGTVRISLRSFSDLPIDPIVRTLGGGGHRKAAGATVKGSLTQVKATVISLLQKSLVG